MNQTRSKHETISSFAELQKMMHDALRIQHPEWIGLDGQSEMCELYEARFAKLLDRFRSSPGKSGHRAPHDMRSALNDTVNEDLIAFCKV